MGSMRMAGIVVAMGAIAGCSDCGGKRGGADAHAGADADADAGADADADADADAGADAAADASALLSDESTLALTLIHRWVAGGYLKDSDAPVVEPTMRAAYAQMRSEELDPKSPKHVARVTIDSDPTLLALAGPKRDRGAIVFLHGWGGRWALPCWQIARTVAPLGLVTACPDDGLVADWWTIEGEKIVKKTVAALRKEGHRTIFLAGLSNGAAGAARMPGRIADPFAGVVLVSGAEPGLPKTGVPTLVIHGKRDAMTGFEGARAYATKRDATLVPLPAGHFSMLVNADAFESALRDFVEASVRGAEGDGG